MCPKCGAQVWLPGTFAKRQRECGECGEVFVVKAVSSARARAAAPSPPPEAPRIDANVICGKCTSCGRQLRLRQVSDRLDTFCPSCGKAIRLTRTPVGQEDRCEPAPDTAHDEPVESRSPHSPQDESATLEKAEQMRLMRQEQTSSRRRARRLAAAIGITAHVVAAVLFWHNREGIRQWLQRTFGF